MELPSLPQRTALWTRIQVDRLVATAAAADRPSIALATPLAYWLGRWQGYVLTLAWTALDAGSQRTRKTGVDLPIDVSAHPELATAIAATQRTSTRVVVSERTGRPYQRHTLGHDWRTIARAAGIPGELQFRDLRATAATELKDSGADVIELTTHTGHSTLSMARRYARPTQTQFRRVARLRLEKK